MQNPENVGGKLCRYHFLSAFLLIDKKERKHRPKSKQLRDYIHVITLLTSFKIYVIIIILEIKG